MSESPPTPAPRELRREVDSPDATTGTAATILRAALLILAATLALAVFVSEFIEAPTSFAQISSAVVSAIAAIAMAIYSALLYKATRENEKAFRQQFEHMERQRRSLQAMADAMRDSATIAQSADVATNRPRLMMRQLSYTIDKEGVTRLEYTLANVGQSRARIIESNITAWKPRKDEEWPGRPPYSDVKDALGPLVIEAGQDHLGTYRDPPLRLDLLLSDMVTAKKYVDLILIGYVIYLDDNDVPRRVGFCRKRQAGGQRFTAVDDPDYEFFY